MSGVGVRLCDGDDVVALASCGVGYVPDDDYVMVGLTGASTGAQVACLGCVPGSLDLDALVTALGYTRAQDSVEAVILVGFGATAVDLSVPGVFEVLDAGCPLVGVVQVRDGRWRWVEPGLEPEQGWCPVRTSEVAVVLPSPAPSREAMLAQVSAGAHPVPGLGAVPCTVAGRRVVEDQALRLAVREAGPSAPPVGEVAEVVWMVAQSVYMRDPFTTRVLDLPDTQRQQVVQAVYAAVRHYRPDAELYGLAALLAWTVDGNGALARYCAQRQQLLGARSGIGALITQALDQGLPPSTWATVCADLTLDTLRGITTPRP